MADNSQRRAVRLFTGGSVTICNNGLATGEQVLMRKHTKNFDIAGAVSEAFDGYVEKSQKLADLVAHLQETPITYSQAGKALSAANSSKIMGAALLFEVSQEFMNPRHPEHGTGTAWGLLNAFTEIVKKTTPVRQLERINEFRHIVLAV
jgi:hypothetical protein